MCQDLINTEPHDVRSLQAANPRPLPLVSQPQTLLLGVAETLDLQSWLIAGVQLDNDFPLEPGVVATGRAPTGAATPKAAI